jgi:large subunit ribosomal protein L9
MKKKLKENTVRDVLLVQDMAKLGSKGEIVTVKKAYFRNYLLPYNFAEVATPEVLAAAEAQKAQRLADEAAALGVSKEYAATIEAVCAGGAITIVRKAGPDGKLFGTVTAAEIADMVEDRSGVKVDKKMVTVPSIGMAGSFLVPIKLHPKVEVTISVMVVGTE